LRKNGRAVAASRVKRVAPLRAGALWLGLAVAVVTSCLSALSVHAQAAALDITVVSATGNGLGGTVVVVMTVRDTAVVRSGETDRRGRIRFEALTAGPYVVRAERLGYAIADRAVLVQAGRSEQVELVAREIAVGLPGVLVEAERRRSRFEESAGATVGELTQRDMKLLPAVGEPDVLRAIEVLPGVISTSDFSSAFNVRGGSADQNLILLDGLPIYNPFHLGGLFSVFNADMIARAQLMAGGFPAQYGGRVSSVLSLESDAGAPGRDVQAGMSLVAARAALGTDVPDEWLRTLGLNTGRARLSLRRSYFDQLLRPFFDFPYHLTDVQAFAEAWTSGGGRVTLTGYTGRDVLDLTGTESFPLSIDWYWGNDVGGVTWTQPLGRAREVTVRAGHTRFSTAIRFPEFDDTEFSSEINQTLLRLDLMTHSRALDWGTGLSVDRSSYRNLAEAAGAVFGEGDARGILLGAYAQLDLRTGDWLIETGGRLDSWRAGDGSSATALQPRLALKRFFNDRNHAVKLAVGRYAQFVHSLRDEEVPVGIDIWVLTSERAPHVVSDQLQVGVEGYVAGGWFGAAEGFVRRFDGVTTFNAAEDPNDPFDDLLEGTGLSYGADLHVRREAGRVRPMLAVSWLRAWREFDDIYSGQEEPGRLRYAPTFDRRLDLDFVVQAMLPRSVELGFRWNFGTGLPYTRPAGAYVFNEYWLFTGSWRPSGSQGDTARTAIVLGPRNASRYPAYHRLDVGVRKTYRKRWGTLTPHLDLLNVYDRRNVLFYFYQYERSPPRRSGISMFPILPTAGLEVRF
jgi:hypothetical protein